MHDDASAHECSAGARPGKLIKDPSVWFPVNAAIDGLDTGSSSPIERLKFIVYQRRMFIESAKTKALLMALINPDKAADCAQAYMEMVIPTDPEDAKLDELRKEQLVKEVEQMGPIPLSQVKVGLPSGAFVSGI